MKKKETKSIEMNREQFLALMKAVYLGNWLANSFRTGGSVDPVLEDFEDIENLIFSRAKDFGFEHYADKAKVGDGKRYPTEEFEEETGVHDLVEEYEEDAFWQNLCEMLGERDFYRSYTPEEVLAMSPKERIEKIQNHISRYEDEIERHGIERLEALKTIDDLGF